MPRARLALPAAVLVAGLLAACSSSDSGSSGGGPAGGSPTLVVQAASDTTSKAGSAKFEQKTVATVSGRELTTTTSGAFDPAHKLATIEVSVAAGGRAQSIQERLVGDALYVTDPQAPDSFYKMSVADLVGTSLGSGADPTAGFQALKAASADVTKVGSEQVRGVATTHYKGTFDENAALAKVSGATKDLLTAAFKGSDVSAVPFEAWVDDQGRLRRTVQTLTISPAGAPVTSRSTIEVYDFGTSVSVSAPPAAQVKDGAPLLAALKSSGTS